MYFVTLEYNGKEYKLEQKTFTSRFWWEEGNGACDCNRSIAIHEKYPDAVIKMLCGNIIKLVDSNLEQD